MQNLITENTSEKIKIKEGDFIRLDDDRWHDHDPYYVHSVEYRENSTATKLVLEDSNSHVFTTTVASHQIIKVA